MEAVLRTPIALVTGSLGSGKTTLLRRIVATADRRLAILMNEFGEIAIDSRVIRGENVDIVELPGGCVCCSLTGEFEAAVNEIIEKAKPDFIVLEATGVAEADALVYEVRDRLPGIRLDSVVCLVDAYAAMKYPSVGYAARSQLSEADVVLINKVDLVAPEEVDAVMAQVRKYNPTAAFLKTVRCEGNTGSLFGFDARERTAPAHPPAGESFESFAFTSGRTFDGEKFRDFVSTLPPSVFRAKGFILLAEGSLLVNYVAGRADFEEFPAERTELVFIGPSLAGDRERILSRLRECEV